MPSIALHATALMGGGADEPIVDPLNPEEALLAELADAIQLVREGLGADGFGLERLHVEDGFKKLRALKDAKEFINASNETRKRFEIAARAVFRKYKSCLTFAEVETFTADYQAINYIYRSLQENRMTADTSAIIQKLDAIVAGAIEIQPQGEGERVFDISKVNFELLRMEFAKSKRNASDVQDLRTVLQEKLARMLAANPTLTDFQDRFDKIVEGYNKEKDKNLIEATFEALIRMTADIEQEAQRRISFGLSQEEKPIFDLLMHDNLSKDKIRQVRSVSVEILKSNRRRMEEVQDLFEKQSTRDGFRQEIYDMPYDDNSGLPASNYVEDTLAEKTDTLFDYFMSRHTAFNPAARLSLH